MNQSTQKALMIVVERAVRPVRASQARKVRMREELMAHLTAIFEDEAALCGDEQTALSQAEQRFGDPGDLAKELQQTVPFVDRAGHLLEITGFRIGDSPRVFAVKYLLGTAIILAVLIPLLLILLSLNGKIAEFGMRARIVAVFCPIVMGFWMLGLIFIARLRKTFFAQGARRFGVRAATDLLLSLVAFPFLAFITYALLTGDLPASLTYSLHTGCLFSLPSPVLFILMARQYNREMRVHEQWTELEIDA